MSPTPFDLQAAIKGAAVQTRDGRKVIQFVYLDKAIDEHTMPVCIVFEDGKATRYPLNGRWIRASVTDHPRDLVMVPRAQYRNVWESRMKGAWVGGPHDDRKDAERAACEYLQCNPEVTHLGIVGRQL